MRDDEWAGRRAEAVRVQAERLRARQDAEHTRAEDMLRRFTAAAHAAKLEPEPLVVRGYGGRGTARTGLRGWYLRVDRSAAVSTDGGFYVLTAPLNLLDRVRGTRPEPARPPLTLGAGGKDGESVPLADALERLLPGWQDG
ncbi:hypothetical protein ACFQHV_02495 [Promicromonospora thailandica]|uniref:Uncharacterized protein n=1 Tax=Promicromonospora thailandica TaxID=765201 RepID=A0A9X2G731_9MICO|nr:hypothetical protein [Promicromonospora thailandica]MCP2266933.1 hypothetical protein [Promicromonospora thailandica]BFF16799.1 hypothetical protein GCM10025730_03200 [Promicromonospora thailandica]